MLKKISELEKPLEQRCRLATKDWIGMALPILFDTLFPSAAVNKATA